MHDELKRLERTIEIYCGMSIGKAEKIFIKIMKSNLLIIIELMKLTEDEFFKIKDEDPSLTKQEVRMIAMYKSALKMHQIFLSGNSKGNNNHEMRKKSKLEDLQMPQRKISKKRDLVLNQYGDIKRWRNKTFSWRLIADKLNQNCRYRNEEVSYRYVQNIFESVKNEKTCNF